MVGPNHSTLWGSHEPRASAERLFGMIASGASFLYALASTGFFWAVALFTRSNGIAPVGASPWSGLGLLFVVALLDSTHRPSKDVRAAAVTLGVAGVPVAISAFLVSVTASSLLIDVVVIVTVMILFRVGRARGSPATMWGAAAGVGAVGLLVLFDVFELPGGFSSGAFLLDWFIPVFLALSIYLAFRSYRYDS